jgi:hypothetical protein
MGDKVYEKTEASLYKDHLILKLNVPLLVIQTKQNVSHLKIDFNFDLIFDIEREDDPKSGKAKLGAAFSIKFERYNQTLTLKNPNIPE